MDPNFNNLRKNEELNLNILFYFIDIPLQRPKSLQDSRHVLTLIDY